MEIVKLIKDNDCELIEFKLLKNNDIFEDKNGGLWQAVSDAYFSEEYDTYMIDCIVYE